MKHAPLAPLVRNVANCDCYFTTVFRSPLGCSLLPESRKIGIFRVQIFEPGFLGPRFAHAVCANGPRMGATTYMVSSVTRPTLVVVGTGMAGAKVVEEVLTRAPDRFNIRMFGAEPHGTYNRILLSSVLGGYEDPGKLWINPLEWYERNGVHVHTGVKADTIDREKRLVIGAGGKVVEPYDYLILATGSRPFVPPMEGTRKPGVFVFRT